MTRGSPLLLNPVGTVGTEIFPEERARIQPHLTQNISIQEASRQLAGQFQLCMLHSHAPASFRVTLLPGDLIACR